MNTMDSTDPMFDFVYEARKIVPGTRVQMNDPCFECKGLLLEGSNPKLEDK